jgi:PAS domain S-box-containing protein
MSEKLSYSALEQKVKDLEKAISSKKQMTGALKQSEDSYAYLIENATDIIYKIDLKGYFSFFNPVAVRVTGYSKEELSTKHYLDLIRSDYREDTNNFYIKQYMNKIESTYYEFPMIDKDGNETWIGQNVQLMREDDQIVGFHAIARDINYQKKSEKSLKKFQESLEASIRARTIELEKANEDLKKEIEQRKSAEHKLNRVLSDLGFLSITATEFLELSPEDDIYEVICERLRQIVGHSIVIINSYEESSNLFQTISIKGLGRYADRVLGLLGKSPVGMTTEMNIEDARKLLQSGRLVQGPKDLHELSFGAVPRPISVAIEKLLGVGEIYVAGFSQRGTIYGSAIIITRKGKDQDDVQARREVIETFVHQSAVALHRKRVEEALRDSEKRYRLLAENVSDVIWTLDLDTLRFSYVSPSVIRMRGFTQEEVMEQRVEEVLSPEAMGKITNILNEELARDGKPGVDPRRSKTMEIQQRNKDGYYDWAEATMTFIRDEQGRPVSILGVTRDISERKQAEEEKQLLRTKLQQSQKLEAVATLAGGIAHQFNNALSGIIGNLELLELESMGQEVKLHLTSVKDTAHRMIKLTNQLLAYARGGKYQAKTISLSQFVRDTLPLIDHTLSPSVHIETDLSPNISEVKADVTQMQMVLSALLSNASEAIEGRGYIRISCREVKIDQEMSEDMSGLKPGLYTRLTVKDDGKGMNNETMQRIFDPFFSTKFQGRGLGMAAVYGIIKNHDGWISVDSEPDHGTMVHIYLPVMEENANGTGKEREEKTKPLGIKGTVLLIDDDEMILDISRAMLEKFGYQAMTARTGKEALEMGMRYDGDICLALLDIRLPDMEAKRVYTELTEIRPDLKVIVCSGYSLEGPAQDILDAGADGFIQKPFSMALLSDKIDSVMNS